MVEVRVFVFSSLGSARVRARARVYTAGVRVDKALWRFFFIDKGNVCLCRYLCVRKAFRGISLAFEYIFLGIFS